MALFNRDYDRSYGYRGNTGVGYGRDFARRGYDRDTGERGGTWESMKRNTREFFGMDRYDRDYDREMNTTYNRNRMGASGYGTSGRMGAHERGFSGRRNVGYDRPYWGYDTWDYDAQYKSRQQTDTGDPFGDRESRTPIRVVDEPRDRGWFSSDREYDRGYRYGGDYPYGRGRRSVSAQYGTGRGYARGHSDRGYDRDWF
jgi:hypothetical protein